MTDLNNGWKLHVDRSPDWIFARLTCDTPRANGEPAIAEAVVAEAKDAGVHRVIFEVGDGVMLFSHFVGQLVAMHKRFLLEGGAFRVCGLNEENVDILRGIHLADRLPNYKDRESAIMGRL
jgi:hypothetical protein